ncbi:MAG: hypothetical protein ACOY4F_07035, partial [Thermodesulfobacteriota bacterium]
MPQAPPGAPANGELTPRPLLTTIRPMPNQSQPPLLPWQILLVCAACGALAVRDPAGPGVACLAVGLLAGVCGAKRVTLALVPAAFALGLGAALLALPDPPRHLPAVALTGKKAVLTGRVASV